MLPSQRIFLIGLPGAGKSTLGRALAADLGWQFVDLDEEIERFTGQRIATLFEIEGESAFREVEAATLRRVGTAAPLVLATGGGTPCFHDSMTWLLAHGTVVWLDVEPEQIARRLVSTPAVRLAERPLLAGAAPPDADPEATILTLSGVLNQTLTARRPFYAIASHRCANLDCTVPVIKRLLGLPALP